MDESSRELRRVAGLKYWREADAQIVVDAWKDSRESVGCFARRWKLTPSRVDRWARRLICEPAPEPAEMVLHPVRVIEATTAEDLPNSDPTANASAWIAEVVRGDWTVNVPHGFQAGELCRLLDVIDEVAR